MMNLAPISIPTYSRLGHLKRTVEALRKNTLAVQSELYFFLDAPSPGDEEKVQAVRNYVYTVNGFKKVHVIERTENNIIENVIGGMRLLTEKYGKMIFLEDDIITSPGFLRFMNDALVYYEGNPRISSISGYCPPINIPTNYLGDVFIQTMFSPWGMAMWKDSFDKIKYISEEEYIALTGDRKRMSQFINNTGRVMRSMIERDYTGEFDGFDVKVIFRQFINRTYTVYPRKSLVQNIGHDGSGVHMGASSLWDVELWDKKENFMFVNDLQPDKRIVRENFQCHDITLRNKIFLIADKFGLYPFLKNLENTYLRYSNSH